MKNKMTIKQKLALALLLVGGSAVFATIISACKNEPETLTGSVNISGKTEVGETLTANVSGSNGTEGKFTYKWTRTGIEITGANGKTYKITEADLDHTLGAIIGNEDTQGTIEGAAASKATNPTKVFEIGGVNFTFEHKFSDTTSWAKLDPVIQNYIEYITNPANSASVHAANITSLAGRTGAKYRIIVDYSEAGKANVFTATDGQTLKVGSEYLATSTINRNTLRDAFTAMLEKPWPIANAKAVTNDAVRMAGVVVPQYNRAMRARSACHPNRLAYHCA